MGSSQSKEPKEHAIDTSDIKKGLTYGITLGRTSDKVSAADFDRYFEAAAKVNGLVADTDTYKAIKESDFGKDMTSAMTWHLDTNNDGKLTADDFVIAFNNRMKMLDNHKPMIDKYAPVVGQAFFGIGCGWLVGRVARSMIRHCFPIVVVGAFGYAGIQSVIQSQFIDTQLLANKFKSSLQNVADYNKDGTINEKDVQQLINDKMSIVSTKLGHGGFLPGTAGGATFVFGLLRGLRFL